MNAPLREFERSLPMQLLRAREAAMSRFRPMLRKHGLTEQQWRALRVLAAFPDIDASEIAERSLLLPPSLSRILQFLTGQRLVRRTQDTNDQRRSVFKLTAKGRRVFDAVAPDSEALYASIADDFGEKRLAALYELLAEFASRVEASA